MVENARQKALEVHFRLTREVQFARGEQFSEEPTLVVGADTVVVLDGRILEKPKSPEAAVQMLTSLSGRAHHVVTGVALVYRGASEASRG